MRDEKRRGTTARAAAAVFGVFLLGISSGESTASAAREHVQAVSAADPSVVGQWSAPVTWPAVAVHAALLKTGKVLTWGNGYVSGPVVWDPATGIITAAPNAVTNGLCGGQSALPDGRVVVIGGGGLNQAGTVAVAAFDPNTTAWSQVASTNYATWYATATVLPDGRLLRLAGVGGCNSCNPEYPEVYDPASNAWTVLRSASALLPMYPFTYVRPDGTIAITGASEAAAALRILDVNAQTWTTADPNVVDGGSAAMYDSGKVVKAGTATDSGMIGPAANTAYVTDLNLASPRWTPTGSMAYPRSFLNLTPLPDGTVLATGGETDKAGNNPANAVYAAEDWSPATGAWTTLAAEARPRLYHSTALLLPDGRVFVAGGGDDPTDFVPDERSAEIFSPPYLFRGTRPAITSAPAQVGYGTAFTVATPDAASIGSVSLIRTGAVTHFFDMSARRVALPFTAGSGSLTVQAPANGAIAPPGYYMLFIVNQQGVPSVAPIVRVTGPATVPGAPSGVSASAGNGAATVSWTAPFNGGSPLTKYTVTPWVGSTAQPSTDVPGSPPPTSASIGGLTNGTTYTFTVTASNGVGSGPPSAASNAVTPSAAAGITIDQTVIQDGFGTVTTPGFSTASPGELLVAFAAADGLLSGGQSLTVSGAGLSWTLAQRTNTQLGTAEVWTAYASTQLTGVTVTSTPAQPAFDQSLTVLAFQGASGIGAVAGASAASGAPTVTVTTSAAGSWVFGVGNDWDHPIARTLGAGQTMVHQWVDTGHNNTFWVQSTTAPTPGSGTAVQLNDTAPTTDQWNFAAVEVRPR
jgi:hypothetical protein